MPYWNTQPPFDPFLYLGKNTSNCHPTCICIQDELATKRWIRQDGSSDNVLLQRLKRLVAIFSPQKFLFAFSQLVQWLSNTGVPMNKVLITSVLLESVLTPSSLTTWPRKVTFFWNKTHFFGLSFRLADLKRWKTSRNRFNISSKDLPYIDQSARVIRQALSLSTFQTWQGVTKTKGHGVKRIETRTR